MAHEIIGEWDVALSQKGESVPLGRLSFFEKEGRLVVVDSDPEVGGSPADVESDGDTLRFEILGAGTSRGATRHVFEVTMRGHASFTGTRRRGMLARVPVAAQRVIDPLDALAGNLAGAKAKAAEAAARAALAAAEAAAAQAEAEAAEAIEAARRAAQKAVAARAAASTPSAATPLVVPSEVLAIIPAPAQPAAVDAPPAPAGAA
ncbi:hypothetical protein [Protaetiibacter larvae]|uniref:Uncharacterized protein n=1 Tax=Protaetiibacter larvae TaxID=2592654 RepID=A0A5C1Y676_9MICO|nr:hypothetical protein [Protaetiibacter larvae]QEO09543.1 hypothetical protein FLP23_05675 [Protaetiibacter larvae]